MQIHQEVVKKRKDWERKEEITNEEQGIANMTKEAKEIDLATSEIHNKYKSRIICRGGSNTQ